MDLLHAMWPELVLAVTALLLFLIGASSRTVARRTAPVLAFVALAAVFILQLIFVNRPATLADGYDTIRIFHFAQYIKILASGIGLLFVLMAWPTNARATGNASLDFGGESGEFFALMLLSIAGVFLMAGANDIMLLFLGFELASIPTYIMVAISRPLAVAQEAGVKYFFLGAMASAVILFGFSYLYGTTGLIGLNDIAAAFAATLGGAGGPPPLTAWQMLAVVMLIVGFAFKVAAVPLHFYAGDVYQGAATPVTAFLAFIPKTSGFVAIIKILFVAGAGSFLVPVPIFKLLWVVAILTMCVGNVLGLLQQNVKRVLAYSSIAHSGYILVGLAALVHAQQDAALTGVLFYLAAYGIMSTGAFAVLMLLPSRRPRVATTAETFEDLAGQGRKYVGLGLAMAVCCFGLTGLPLTIGLFGKVYLIWPALQAGLKGLVIILIINSAVSAGYYLRIVAAMFMRPLPQTAGYPTTPAPAASAARHPFPILTAVGLCAIGTLGLGIVLPLTQSLTAASRWGVEMDSVQIQTVNAAAPAPPPLTGPPALTAAAR